MLASYVGNGTDEFVNQWYLVFPGNGRYTWYDYVNQREIMVETNGSELTVDGEPATNWEIRGKGA